MLPIANKRNSVSLSFVDCMRPNATILLFLFIRLPGVAGIGKGERKGERKGMGGGEDLLGSSIQSHQAVSQNFTDFPI